MWITLAAYMILLLTVKHSSRCPFTPLGEKNQNGLFKRFKSL